MIENIGAYSQFDYDRGYQKGRADAIEEVYRAWLDWNSGKFEEQYFDDVIDKLKEKK